MFDELFIIIYLLIRISLPLSLSPSLPPLRFSRRRRFVQDEFHALQELYMHDDVESSFFYDP